MIIFTMEFKEVRKELLNDLTYFSSMMRHEAKEYRRKALKTKSRRFPLVTESIKLSPRKNKWLIYQLSENKRDFNGKEKQKFACIAHDSKGRKSAYEYFIYNKQNWIFRFSAHFFDRYKERMSLSDKGDELIAKYFRENRRYMIAIDSWILDEDREYQAVVFSEEGVGLGRLQGQLIAIATFLPKKNFNRQFRELYKDFEHNSESSWISHFELIEKMESTGIREFTKRYF